MNFPFEKEIILEDSVAILRPLQSGDLADLLGVASEDKQLLQFSQMPVYTEDLLKTYIEKAVGDRQNKVRYPFTIFSKTKNLYAGSTSFLNISNPDDRLEIGATWIGNGFQKTGLNRSCKYLLLDFAFGNLGAERVEFRTDERNMKSRTAIEKIGAQFEGVLRNHMLMQDGYRRNTVCYSILKDEWTDLKPGFLKK